MAFQQTHESSTGSSANYWKVVQTNFDQLAKTGKVTIFVYRTKAARVAGKASMGQRNYSISGDEFTTHFSPDALGPAGRNTVERSYIMAKARREIVKAGFQKINEKYYADADVTDGQPDERAAEVDEDTAAESFFDGATDV